MLLSDIYQALGRDRFEELVSSISMGSLRTYRVYDSLKVRAHLNKLNRERLQRAIPQLWTRLQEKDEGLAREMAQGILISHLGFIAEVLDFLEIPHDGNGFFEKDDAAREKLVEGWRQRVWDHFHGARSPALVLFYINHLDWELGNPGEPFVQQPS